MDKELTARIEERLELMYAHADWKSTFYRQDVEALLDEIKKLEGDDIG